MAALHSPEARKRTSRRSTVPAAPKLRDSCNACAASKVKCNKEKPICARCAKRGMRCEYFVTKRAGRKHEPRPSDTTTITKAGSSTSSDADILRTPDPIHVSPGQQTVGYTDISPSVLSPGDPASWWMLTTLSTEIDDFFASPVSFPAPETSDSDTTTQSLFFSRDGTCSTKSSFDSSDVTAIIPDAFVVIDDACETTDLSKQSSPPDSQSPFPSDTFNFQDFCFDSPCCCLLQALSLLKQLLRKAATVCTCTKKQGYSHTSDRLPTIQSVIAENGQTIESINDILLCRCSQDGYLLVIISLIVFKILGWYAAAAKEIPEAPVTEDDQSLDKAKPESSRHLSCHSEQVLHVPTTIGSHCFNGGDQRRMAAKLVLSELHRVQRLVNQLSSRLKAADGQDSGQEGNITSPFSATMLNQLEADLCKRLQALSLEIVDVLSQG